MFTSFAIFIFLWLYKSALLVRNINPFTVMSCKFFSMCCLSWLCLWWFCHANFHFYAVHQFFKWFLDRKSECLLHSTAIIHLYFLLEFLWLNFFNLNFYSFGVYPGMRCKLWIQPNFSPDDCPVLISFIELFIFSLLVQDVTFIIPKMPSELGSLFHWSMYSCIRTTLF